MVHPLVSPEGLVLHLGTSLLLTSLLWSRLAPGHWRVLGTQLLVVLSTMPWWTFFRWLVTTGAGWGDAETATWEGLRTLSIWQPFAVYLLLAVAQVAVALASHRQGGVLAYSAAAFPPVLLVVVWLSLGFWLPKGAPLPDRPLADNTSVVWYAVESGVAALILAVWIKIAQSPRRSQAHHNLYP